jgi:hypothetical protein
VRKSAGRATGFVGPGVEIGRVFAHDDNAVPIRIMPTKITIMIFGNRNTIMNAVEATI